jgi:hypothetical protein
MRSGSFKGLDRRGTESFVRCHDGRFRPIKRLADFLFQILRPTVGWRGYIGVS